MLLDDEGQPGLECQQCIKLIPDAIPLCQKGGCPIEGIAADLSINRLALRYLRLKHVREMSGDDTLIRQFYDEEGFYLDEQSFFEIERIFRKWTAQESRKHRDSQRS